jgi:Protein of unknown function (DUF2829)
LLDEDEFQKRCCGNCGTVLPQFTKEEIMDFSEALKSLKEGKRLMRSGWNGKGMFVFLVAGSNFVVNREPLLSILGEGFEVTYQPHIDIKMNDGTISVWQPSMGDVMANDWAVVGI